MWIETYVGTLINMDKVQRVFIRSTREDDEFLVVCYLDLDGELNWERDTGPNTSGLYKGTKEECNHYLLELKYKLKVQKIGGE